MIKNILDSYISSNLIRCMKSWAIPYGIDVMTVKANKLKTIYIKDRRYADRLYKEVLKVRDEDAILYLSNLTKSREEFIKIIKDYQKVAM